MDEISVVQPPKTSPGLESPVQPGPATITAMEPLEVSEDPAGSPPARSKLRIFSIILMLCVSCSHIFRRPWWELTAVIARPLHRGARPDHCRNCHSFNDKRPELRCRLYVDRCLLSTRNVCRKSNVGAHQRHLGPQACRPRCKHCLRHR